MPDTNQNILVIDYRTHIQNQSTLTKSCYRKGQLDKQGRKNWSTNTTDI